MTVSTEVTRVIVEGDGVTTVFSYSFPVPGSSATDQTNAELTLLAPDGTITDIADNLWSITGVQGTSGTFTYNPGSPLTTGNFLTLNRVVPYLQTTTLSAQGAYSPEVVEAALDNLAFQTEQLNTVALQSLRAPITDAALNDLPTEVLRANRYLAFDTNGQATVSGVLNTASGFVIVETQSANTLAPASVLNFVNGFTAVETVSGRVDITLISGVPGGTTGQIQFNAGGGAFGGLTFSGDMTLTTAGTASLSTTGVTAAQYTNATVTVDAKGRVTAASSGGGLGNFSGIRLDLTTTHAVTSSLTVVSWDTAAFNVGSWWTSGSNIVIPSGVAYVHVDSVMFFPGASAAGGVAIYQNGAATDIEVDVNLANGQREIPVPGGVLSVSTGDVITIQGFVSGSGNVGAGSFVSVYKVG